MFLLTSPSMEALVDFWGFECVKKGLLIKLGLGFLEQLRAAGLFCGFDGHVAKGVRARFR